MEERIDPGVIGERMAAGYLRLRGYRIVEQNYRTGHLEIDLIALDGYCLAFVEVKLRRGDSFGRAVEAVGPGKIRNLKKAARRYLSQEQRPTVSEIRFDLVAVDLDSRRDMMVLTHIKGIS